MFQNSNSTRAPLPCNIAMIYGVVIAFYTENSVLSIMHLRISWIF